MFMPLHIYWDILVRLGFIETVTVEIASSCFRVCVKLITGEMSAYRDDKVICTTEK